jgi:hypothetical protein
MDQKLRKQMHNISARRGLARPMEWAELALTIPEELLPVLILLFPDLDSPDRQTKTKAWKAFANHSMSQPFRVSSQHRRRF